MSCRYRGEHECLLSGVVVVEDDLDHLVLRENELVRVGAVDGWVSSVGPCRECGVQRWNFGGDICHVVEESTGRKHVNVRPDTICDSNSLAITY